MTVDRLSTRVYGAPQDLDAVLDLTERHATQGWGRAYCACADLRELLSLPPVAANTQLWFDASGRLRGCALVDHYHNLCFVLDPAIRGLEVERQVVARGDECVRRDATPDETVTLNASADEDDLDRILFLRRHNFSPLPERSLHLVRRLDLPIPGPSLPAGYRIRPVTGVDEVEALVALHRAAFGTEHMTVEERRAMMSGADYDAALDLVVVAPDGSPAAYCLCQIDREENRRTGRQDGYTDPVATHPAHRRLGLARSLLLAGMALLRDRGMRCARLGTSSENLAMQRAAKSVGFAVESSRVWFARPVTACAVGG